MKKIVMSLATATLLIGSVGSGPASAHQRTEPTRLSIHVNTKNIDAGEKVKFKGRLKSDWHRCVKFKKVSLFKGTKKVLTKETTRSGRYRFSRSPKNTNEWHVEFAGKRLRGAHPHVHRCLSSESKSIRVRVS
ncbi:MAG: hypothetical protein ACRDGK_07025 [Actinomycetota bacterium]